MFRLSIALATLVLASSAQAGPFTENFDSLSDMISRGWVVVNNSTPDPLNTSWFQGNAGIFPAHSGAANSYVAANFNAAPFGGAASLWLISPVLRFFGGGQISFFTRTVAQPTFNDTLEVRVNFTDTSADVGNTPTSTGNFALLGTIGGADPYPTDWAQFAILNLTTEALLGRIAFRYVITDTSVAGEYVGLDTLTSEGCTVIPEPGTLVLLGGALAALAAGRRLRTRD